MEPKEEMNAEKMTQFVESVATELLKTFSAKEQREIINGINNRVVSTWNERRAKILAELEEVEVNCKHITI